jgi:putative glutamine amidotransferase
MTCPDDDPEEALALVDGLLLMGGGDVEPSCYGADPATPELYGIEPDRDAFEIALVRAAERHGVPTLAICRGIQVLNVAFGGSLHPHLPDVEGIGVHGEPLSGAPVPHDVKLAAGSRITQATAADMISGSSHHHQGIDAVGQGLVPTGWTEDGLVESLELEAGWVLGVQWHPEETAAADPAQQGLFDALVRRAGRS